MTGACKRRPDRPLSRSRFCAPDSARIICSTPRTRDSNFYRTADLTTSVYAAEPQLSVDVPHVSLRAIVRSLSRSRSRAIFGVRKSFPTRCSHAELIELDKDSSPPLNSTSHKLYSDGIFDFLRFTEPLSWSRVRSQSERGCFTTTAPSLS